MPIKLHRSRQEHASPAALIEEDIRLGLKIVEIYKESKFYKKLKTERAIATIIRSCNGALGAGGNYKNGCLYRQKELKAFWKTGSDEKVVCDHAIPVTELVKMYSEQNIDLRELIFSPVVRITSEADYKLKKNGYAKKGTFENLPLFRYSHIDIEIVTHTNQMVDPRKWTYKDHWDLINHSTPELTETLKILFEDSIPYK